MPTLALVFVGRYNHAMSESSRSLPKRVVFYLLLFLIPVIGAFVIGEVGVRLFSPLPYMYPRYMYSPDYGFMLYPSNRHGVTDTAQQAHLYTLMTEFLTNRL